MKTIIVAALVALAAVNVNAKGFGAAHMPKFGSPRPAPEAKAEHSGHAMKIGKAPKAVKLSATENAFKQIDDIADKMFPEGQEPMVAAKYAAH